MLGNAVETCSKVREFNCGGGGGCIPVEKACDGHNHCGNWEDEPDTCNKNECDIDNGGCQQVYYFIVYSLIKTFIISVQQ